MQFYLGFLSCCLISLSIFPSHRCTQSINNLPNPSADSRLQLTPVRRGYLIQVGQNLSLNCPFNAPFYHWTSTNKWTQILEESQVYQIKSATVKDSGRYSCNAVHGYGLSSAQMSVRVIDPLSRSAQHECALNADGSINLNGPCFLNSYSDRELSLSGPWGSSVTLDCDAVIASESQDHLIYSWEFVSLRQSRPDPTNILPGSNANKQQQQRLMARTPTMSNGQMAVAKMMGPNLSQFKEPELKIEKLNLAHSGEYRCVVENSQSSLTRSTAISRTFRLVVKPRSDGRIIQGPRITNETVQAGHDAIFPCEVDPSEHRSSTIRWGKSIDLTQRLAYEAQGREVIQWSGGTFVVLPGFPGFASLNKNTNAVTLSNPNQDFRDPANLDLLSKERRILESLLPTSGAIATESSPGQSSQLVLRQASASDSGRYVCSVLTESGRDDHKFVQISVLGDTPSQTGSLVGNGTRRLTLYIAVPTVIFIVCLCVVTYCLITKRASRNRQGTGSRHQRNYFGHVQQTQIKPPSAASSSSIGVCRNGMSANSGGWTSSGNTGDPRMRLSPAGTALGAAGLGYTSTNGSNSMAGTGPMNAAMTAPGYQTNVPGNVGVVSVTYPILMQQQVPSFYSVPDCNPMDSYGQNVSPVTTAGSSEFMMNNAAMACFPQGIAYPIANGHPPTPNNPNVIPTSVFNSSSPESSAINGPGSPSPNEPVEGRLVFRPHGGQQPSPLTQQQQQQPVSQQSQQQQVFAAFPTPISNTTTNRGFVYPSSQNHTILTNLPDYEAGLANTPLLPYHNLSEASHDAIRA